MMRGIALALLVASCESSDAQSARLDAGATDAQTATGSDAEAELDSGDATAWGSYDLDRDGIDETDLAVAACPEEPARLCLIVTRQAGALAITLPEEAKPAAGGTASMTGRPLRAIGDHGGGPLSEVSVLFQIGRGTFDSPALAVVDVEAEAIVALASAPPGLATFAGYGLASFTDFARDDEGRLHPFLAPGYGDSDAAPWGTACLFQIEAPGGPSCGPGFLEASTVPAEAGWFREVGGYLQDLDGDGWEDLNLIFHERILTISSRTAENLVTTTFDVAAADEPSAPHLFHSGRNYGTHSSFTGGDGRLRDLIVGGAPVGTFEDANCNVSRFVAVLESEPAVPASRVLRWSRYLGFASTIFATNDPAFVDDPAADVARLGDFMDGCIHRFSDSRTVIDGVEAVMVDAFLAEGPVDTCLWEQYQLYQPPAWTEEKSDAWYTCFNQNVASMGSWAMQARRIDDGATITGSTQTYVWGRTDRLLPGGEIVYLVEALPERTRFDLADVAATPLFVHALVDGLWASRGVMPVAGRPALGWVAPEGPVGVGSFTSLLELDLVDVDGDGLGDLALADGTRVGWDAASGSLVVK